MQSDLLGCIYNFSDCSQGILLLICIEFTCIIQKLGNMAFTGFKNCNIPHKQEFTDAFYKISGEIHSKIVDQTCIGHSAVQPLSKNKPKRINVILIPDFSYLTQSRSRENQQKNTVSPNRRVRRKSSVDIYINPNIREPRASEDNKLCQLFEEQSHILKYLWDRNQNAQVDSRRYNIFYQQSDSRFNIQTPQKKEIDEPFSETENLSMLSLSQKKSSIHYSIKKDQNGQSVLSRNPSNNETMLENKLSLMSKNTMVGQESAVTKNMGIDVWNSQGLKHGSNVLKFGIRNKNVAIVVHHEPNISNLRLQSQNTRNFMDEFNIRSTPVRLSETRKEWSKFIRQVNKKCVIAHLYIQQVREKDPFLEPDDENQIKITKELFQDNEYIIELKVFKEDRYRNNNRRLLLIIDLLLDKRNGGQFSSITRPSCFSFSNQSHSLVLQNHSSIARYLKIKRSISKNKEKIFDISCPQEKIPSISICTRNAPQSQKNKDLRNPISKKRSTTQTWSKYQELPLAPKQLSATVSLKSQGRKGIFGYFKNLCCSASDVEESLVLSEDVPNPEYKSKESRSKRNA